MSEEITNTTNTTGYDQYFTETTEGLDIVANNIEANCITSGNDKFSLDSDGNLTVNSLTISDANNNTLSFEAIFNRIYPVGSIYISTNDVNPGSIFTGTWEKIEGKFLLGSSSSYTLGSDGGSANHSHSIPNHTHDLGDSGYACVDFSASYINTRELSSGVSYQQNLRKTISGAVASKSETRAYGTALGGKTGNQSSTITTGSTTTLPPYVVVSIYKRVS